eukprot:13677808-Alexandrium_andersonii.AAC.1
MRFAAAVANDAETLRDSNLRWSWRECAARTHRIFRAGTVGHGKHAIQEASRPLVPARACEIANADFAHVLNWLYLFSKTKRE